MGWGWSGCGPPGQSHVFRLGLSSMPSLCHVPAYLLLLCLRPKSGISVPVFLGYGSRGVKKDPGPLFWGGAREIWKVRRLSWVLWSPLSCLGHSLRLECTPLSQVISCLSAALCTQRACGVFHGQHGVPGWDWTCKTRIGRRPGRKSQGVGCRGGEAGGRQPRAEPLEGLRAGPQTTLQLSDSFARHRVHGPPAGVWCLSGMGSCPTPSLARSHTGQEELPRAPRGPLFLRGD